ncbi:hypothetical protein SeMB42_g02089 [Synchytrium endobioticum]|uniref:Uncharacterized protein n=1 Tax=Synchytrium endobioticum TaxID=286115 RepID=A0A507DHU5_9FUNG|nr:hypothetical protein SeLEV6574_g08531 [Synchytrium endobioticum]TPX50885.1 hypothetical protein SeMB42_g02089 [Synchytrium endobioticum]
MLVDSQDPPVIRAKQPRNMDYVKISGVLIPTAHLTVVARPASSLGQRHNGRTVSSLVTLAIEASSQYLLMQQRQQIDQTICIIDTTSWHVMSYNLIQVYPIQSKLLARQSSHPDVLIPVLATVKSNPNTIIRLNDLMEFKRDATRPLLSKTKAVGRSSASGSKKKEFSSSASPSGSKNQNTIVRVVLAEANGRRREKVAR